MFALPGNGLSLEAFSFTERLVGYQWVSFKAFSHLLDYVQAQKGKHATSCTTVASLLRRTSTGAVRKITSCYISWLTWSCAQSGYCTWAIVYRARYLWIWRPFPVRKWVCALRALGANLVIVTNQGVGQAKRAPLLVIIIWTCAGVLSAATFVTGGGCQS